jgi:hypothetical protein
MKCATHPSSDAIAVCTHCGRAVCPDCAKSSPSKRTVCSEACAAALTEGEIALRTLLQKHLQTSRINAFFYLLCGVLSGVGAIAANEYLPSPFLIWFCAGCSLVFILAGAWFLWSTKKLGK